MARWAASAKWAAGPALNGRRATLLGLGLNEGLGVTESRPPVAWFSPKSGDRDNSNLMLCVQIDKRELELLIQNAPRTMVVRWSKFWSFCCPYFRSLNGPVKAFTEAGTYA